ncbi:hypothetical protein ACFQ0I_10240 [Mariniflexile aquimaris]|uniref:Antibiotic biosynthesis monooxygenase n=1 Tax=Mariniflexile aquimaris TaxID=881009 RepID=A0ABW3BSL0_9FLAO
MKSVTVMAFLLFFTINLNAQKNQSELAKLKSASPDVVAVHDVELLPGQDAKAFETFVLNEIKPIYDKMKGQSFSLFKGDRGNRTNLYAFILSFNSIEDRDRIYTPSGEMVGDFGDKAVWEKLKTMAKVFYSHTDYVKVKK